MGVRLDVRNGIRWIYANWDWINMCASFILCAMKLGKTSGIWDLSMAFADGGCIYWCIYRRHGLGKGQKGRYTATFIGVQATIHDKGNSGVYLPRVDPQIANNAAEIHNSACARGEVELFIASAYPLALPSAPGIYIPCFDIVACRPYHPGIFPYPMMHY